MSSPKSHYPKNQGYPPCFKTRKYFKKNYPQKTKNIAKLGYKHTLTYKRPNNDNNSAKINKIKQNKNWQIVLNLLDKHFPPHNKLHRRLNKTNVKISYSCMPNMNSNIYMHNN